MCECVYQSLGSRGSRTYSLRCRQPRRRRGLLSCQTLVMHDLRRGCCRCSAAMYMREREILLFFFSFWAFLLIKIVIYSLAVHTTPLSLSLPSFFFQTRFIYSALFFPARRSFCSVHDLCERVCGFMTWESWPGICIYIKPFFGLFYSWGFSISYFYTYRGVVFFFDLFRLVA